MKYSDNLHENVQKDAAMKQKALAPKVPRIQHLIINIVRTPFCQTLQKSRLRPLAPHMPNLSFA